MKNSFWNKRIPSLLGLLMIGIGIFTATIFSRQVTDLFLRAAPSEVPSNIRITNVSDTSFSVTYMTEANVIGTVVLQPDNASGVQKVILDDRDQASGKPTQYQLHSITMRDLNPQTTYQFSINSGTTTYLDADKPFSATTGSTIQDNPASQNPVIGKISLPGGDNPAEAIVYITLPNAQTLSTLTKDSGTYILPMTGIRTSDLKSFVTFDDKVIFQILAVNNTLSSKVFVSIKNSNPVPLIILSNDYDFTVNTNPIASTSAQALGFPEFPIDTSIRATPQIQTPTDNETFTDTQPILKGQAVPNSAVEITIHSDEKLTATVVSDSNGNWSYRPNRQLTPGQHTITITTKDKFGVMQTIQKAFTIFQSGTQVAEAATPSATLAPSPTLTQTPTPTLSANQTPSPTGISTTVTPTPTVTQLLISPTSAQTKGGLPATGNNTLIFGTAAGIVTTIVGAAIFVLSRGIPL